MIQTIRGEQVKDGTIEGTDIKETTISGSKLVNGTIATLQITDGAITPIKLNLSTQSGILINRSATQALTANTWTRVQFNTEAYDILSEYNNTTYRFTALTAGRYFLTARVGWSAGTATATANLVVYKNGTIFEKLAGDYTTVASGDNSGGSTLLNLAANDYIEIYAYCNKVRTISSAATETYLTMIKVA